MRTVIDERPKTPTITLNGSNPIVKVAVGAASQVNYPYRHRIIKAFRAVCPDCEQIVHAGDGYGGMIRTRKQAKDALHRHQSIKGGYWGCPASPPALEGQ